MPEDSTNINVKDTAEAVGAILDKVPIYPDLIQPAAQELGKTLGGVLRVALSPFNLMVWGFNNIRNYLEPALTIKLSSVPIENIISPAPEIAGPAIEALRFTGSNEELRELYANIIATSMDISTAELAHPSFVEILKNLSSDECRILQRISEISKITDYLAAIELIRKNKETGDYDTLYKNFSVLNEEQLKHSNHFLSYLNNLSRLTIIEVSYLITLGDESPYEELENSDIWNSIKSKYEIPQNEEFAFNRGLITITPYGKQFLRAVVQEKV